ncbi:MAG: hypothetical protein HYS98_04770 [Deltaproteobacteria bacterium]|nr:hypothetical protein [Deltaproteobacteria bacterium]
MKIVIILFSLLFCVVPVIASDDVVSSAVKLNAGEVSEVVTNISKIKIEEKDSGELNDEGLLCDQTIVYTAYIKSSYEPPKITYGDDDKLLIKMTLENVHIDSFVSYKSSWTLCDTVAAELEVNLDSVFFDLTVHPFENDDGEWEYGIKFNEVKLGKIYFSYPVVPDFVVTWLNSYVNNELGHLLKSDFGKKFRQAIERKIKDILD